MIAALAVLLSVPALVTCHGDSTPPVVAVLYTPTMEVGMDTYLESVRQELAPEVDLRSFRLPVRLEDMVEQGRDTIRAWEPSVVLFHGASQGAVAMAPLLFEEGVPHILTSSTSQQLVGITRYTHRLVPSDTVQGRVLARFAVRGLGVTRPAVLYRRDDYGVSITEGLVRELDALGIGDVFLLPYDGGSDWDLLVEGVAALHEPDAIFLAGYGTNASELVPRLRSRLPGVHIIGTDGVVSPASGGAPEGWREALTGIFMATFWIPNDDSSRERELLAQYRAQGGTRGSHFLFLLEDGIQAARAAVLEDPDRRSVQRYLRDLGVGRPPLPGLTGPIQFGAERGVRVRIARLGAEGPEPVAWNEEDPAPGGSRP